MRKRAEISGNYLQDKKKLRIYAASRSNSWLSRAESREGKTKSTLPILKESLRCGSFLFQVSLHENLSRFVVRSHVQQHMIGLVNKFYKPADNRVFPVIWKSALFTKGKKVVLLFHTTFFYEYLCMMKGLTSRKID